VDASQESPERLERQHGASRSALLPEVAALPVARAALWLECCRERF
jgi:hypothetical protein